MSATATCHSAHHGLKRVEYAEVIHAHRCLGCFSTEIRNEHGLPDPSIEHGKIHGAVVAFDGGKYLRHSISVHNVEGIGLDGRVESLHFREFVR